jgi:hypothetical protein
MPTIKTTTTTTIEYPVKEFIELLKEKAFPGKNVTVKFVIEEVGGDIMDRYPGHDEVTKVRIQIDETPR